jgi:hypothetical protein
MKEMAVLSWDDFHLRQQEGYKVPAETTVTIGLNGDWYELDLTAANAGTVMEQIADWAAAGRKPESPPRPSAPQRGPDRRNRAYNKAMRDWADENGFEYVTAKGSYFYGRDLLTAYERHLACTDA